MKAFITSLLLLPFLLTACGSGGASVASIKGSHVHGMAVDRGNSSRLYLATHNGLYVFVDDTDVQRMGKSRDDFMGFSPHPLDPNILFSSGHPTGGGNLGFLKSTNRGETWEKVSNANPQGPADFHAMMVHPANPDHIYGWFKLRVHRSLDGGKTWEVLPKQPPEVLSFAGDSRNDTILFLGSIGDLLVSTDRGETWESMTDRLKSDVVFDIDVDPATGFLFLATRDQGVLQISKSPEGSILVEHLGNLPGGDIPQYLALDPNNSRTLYAFSKAHSLFKSTDGGRSWQTLF